MGGKVSRVLRQPGCWHEHIDEGSLTHRNKKRMAGSVSIHRERQLSRANEWPTYFIIDSGKFDRR